MPMDGSAAGSRVAAAIKSSRPDPTAAVTDAQLEAQWQLVCTEIIAEVKKALVTVPAAGLISGGPGAPVSGSAKGTLE